MEEQKLAAEQGKLREDLDRISDKMEEKLGMVPDGMEDADRHMKMAVDALEDGDLPSAIRHQQDALEALYQNMDGEMDRLAAMLENVISLGLGGGSGSEGRGDGRRDPLGREDGRDVDTTDINIPDEKDRTRIQEIIRELRQRSNDHYRPDFEKEYYERLLRRF
jgi:hypothetical protein